MAFNELERKRHERTVDAYVQKRRPPPHIRPKLDICFKLESQSVEIFEVRPVWRGEPGETMEHSVAKATFVRSSDIWKVFWKRADGKWHAYAPDATVNSIEAFLAVVERDSSSPSLRSSPCNNPT